MIGIVESLAKGGERQGLLAAKRYGEKKKSAMGD